MSTEQNTNENDVLNFANNTKPELPSGLNILTILTFIGSGIGLIGTAATPYLIKFSKSMMDKALAMGSDLPDAQLKKILEAKKLVDLTAQNLVPLVIIGLVSVIACIIGALWMRKLRKDGYTVYVAGEVLPILGNFIFLGTAQFSDWKNYLGLIIPVVFIALYTAHRKYLVK